MVYCLVAFHVTEPDALQPWLGMLNVQFTVPLACVGDWKVPENSLLEKELPVIGIDVASPEVTVSEVGQFDPRFEKLTVYEYAVTMLFAIVIDMAWF
jgi:hypothetical protein